eukprot:395063-Rhodomonas_salina.4
MRHAVGPGVRDARADGLSPAAHPEAGAPVRAPLLPTRPLKLQRCSNLSAFCPPSRDRTTKFDHFRRKVLQVGAHAADLAQQVRHQLESLVIGQSLPAHTCQSAKDGLASEVLSATPGGVSEAGRQPDEPGPPPLRLVASRCPSDEDLTLWCAAPGPDGEFERGVVARDAREGSAATGHPRAD